MFGLSQIVASEHYSISSDGVLSFESGDCSGATANARIYEFISGRVDLSAHI
jgi:hypothetical protein